VRAEGVEEDVPWVPRIADLGDGINQCTLPFGAECNMEVDSCAGGWVAQTLPVYWNGMPGVLHRHVIPGFKGRHEVGEEHSSEEEEYGDPVVPH
jgi:hypothetical protein